MLKKIVQVLKDHYKEKILIFKFIGNSLMKITSVFL